MRAAFSEANVELGDPVLLGRDLDPGEVEPGSVLLGDAQRAEALVARLRRSFAIYGSRESWVQSFLALRSDLGACGARDSSIQ